MPAHSAYNAGISSIQYTIRGIPPDLDNGLRRQAADRGISLNALVIETLRDAVLTRPSLADDLAWFIGSSEGPDAEMEEALAWLDSMPRDLG